MLTYVGLVVFVVAVVILFSTQNDVIFSVAGVITLAGLIYSIVLMTRSKHLANSTRRAGCVAILPAMVLIVAVYKR